MSNTNSKVLKIAQLLGIGVVLWLSLFLRVSCASNPIVTISGITTTDRSRLDALVIVINDTVKADADITWDFLTVLNTGHQDTYSIEINMSQYKECEMDRKRNIMQATLDTITNSDLSVTNRNKLYNFIANEDTSTSSLVRQLSNDADADFGNAYYKFFKPWSGAFGIFLGVIALGIFMLLGVTICFDMAFIVLPALQAVLIEKEDVKAKLVSMEADKAVKEAYSADKSTRRDVLTIYLKSKSKQLVVLSICLLYLVSGNIYNGLAMIIDYFSGILS